MSVTAILATFGLSSAGLVAYWPILVSAACLGLAVALRFGIAAAPRGRASGVVGYLLVLVCFAVPLTAMWAGGPDGANVLLGVLQRLDAAAYEEGAYRLWQLGQLDEFGSRRPFTAAVLGALFAGSGGSTMAAQAVFVWLNATAVFLAARALAATHGPAAGLACFAALLTFYHWHMGSLLSENLGLALGAVAFALLWDGVRAHRGWQVALGLVALSFALNARAGALFVLPILVAWLSWRARDGGRRAVALTLAWTLAATASGFAASTVLGRAYASDDGMAFGNFAPTLYGVVAGNKGWQQVYRDHPEVLEAGDPADRYAAIYRLAIDQARAHPWTALHGIADTYNDFFFNTDWHEFYDDPVSRGIALILTLIGLWWAWKHRRQPASALLLVVQAGVFLSVPMLADGGTRVYAATIPVTAALMGIGLAAALRMPAAGGAETPPRRSVGAASAAILAGVVLLVLPAVPLYAGHPSAAPDLPDCADGQMAIALLGRADSRVVVLPDGDPRVGTRDYRAASSFAADNDARLAVDVPPPFVLARRWNPAARQMSWIAVPGDGPGTDGPIRGCGHRSANVLVLDQPQM